MHSGVEFASVRYYISISCVLSSTAPTLSAFKHRAELVLFKFFMDFYLLRTQIKEELASFT